MLCKFISDPLIELWVVTWALGLKKCHKSRNREHTSKDKVPRCMHTHVVGVYRASETHPFPYQVSFGGFNGTKTQWDLRACYLIGWDGCWDLFADVEGMYDVFPSIPLP